MIVTKELKRGIFINSSSSSFTFLSLVVYIVGSMSLNFRVSFPFFRGEEKIRVERAGRFFNYLTFFLFFSFLEF